MNQPSQLRAKRRDYRLPTLLALSAAVIGLGYAFSVMPGRGVQADTAPKTSAAPHAPMGFSSLAEAPRNGRGDVSEALPIDPLFDPKDPDAQTASRIMKEADGQIRQKQYDRAIATLNRERALMQKYPESYVLLGRALEGKKEFAAARDFYNTAISRDPYFADAYWGYATSSEGLHDLESALGAMRSYLHTEPDRDPKRLRIAQARSAIWEWETALGRGPWGPTKGVPPGFTPDEIKRDGKGVGVKMPVPGTEGPDGLPQSEIKSGKKLKIFERP